MAFIYVGNFVFDGENEHGAKHYTLTFKKRIRVKQSVLDLYDLDFGSTCFSEEYDYEDRNVGNLIKWMVNRLFCFNRIHDHDKWFVEAIEIGILKVIPFLTNLDKSLYVDFESEYHHNKYQNHE